MEGVLTEHPILPSLRLAAPVAAAPYTLPGRTGLIIVDEVNGFCTVGAGPLAPAAPDARVDAMIAETDRIARRFLAEGRPVLAFRDTHQPGRLEPPYPPHCEIGTGQEKLVDRLAWLETAPGSVAFLNKDVIDGVVGGIAADGTNRVYDWIRTQRLEAVVLVGICTDICVADATLTLLSSRNHYFGDVPMLPGLRDIVVYEPACATYHLPADAVRTLGLPDTAAHDAGLFHHIGLSIMQSRGAVIASELR
jgi:nicotinamidase-related amidase